MASYGTDDDTRSSDVADSEMALADLVFFRGWATHFFSLSALSLLDRDSLRPRSMHALEFAFLIALFGSAQTPHACAPFSFFFRTASLARASSSEQISPFQLCVELMIYAPFVESVQPLSLRSHASSRVVVGMFRHARWLKRDKGRNVCAKQSALFTRSC